jgi:O-antigen/teichoic acid export membrane protein
MLRAPAADRAGDQEPEDRAGLGDVARGSTLNLAGAVLSAAATLGVTVAVTRSFSRPVAGAFFAATSLFLIIETIASLGAYNGLIYFLAHLRSLRSRGRVPALLRAAVIPVAVASVTAAAALLVFAEPLAKVLLGGHLHAGVSPRAVATAVRGLALTLPFAAMLDTYLGASRGYRDMRPTVVIDRIGRSSLQLAGVGVAVLMGSAALLAPLWALPYVPASVLAWIWFHRVRRRSHEKAARKDTDRSQLRDRPAGERAGPGFAGFWRFNAPRSLATIAQMIIQRLDIVLVGIMRGPVDAAIYTAATRFLVVGQLGNAALSMAAQPQLTHLFAIGDRRGAGQVYQVTTAWLIILTWPLYLLAVVYGPAVLAVFGHSYRAGSTVMVILGLAMLVATGCGQVDIVLTTTGRTSWSLMNGLMAVVVNVGVDLALIPRYGITGAAIGWAAAIAITNLVPLTQVAKVVRVHPFGRGTLVAGLLTTLSFGVIPLALRWLGGDGLVISALAVVTGCAVLAAGLWRFREPLQLAVLPGFPARKGGPSSAAARRGGQHRAPRVRGDERELSVNTVTTGRAFRLSLVATVAVLVAGGLFVASRALAHQASPRPPTRPAAVSKPSPKATPGYQFTDANLSLVPAHGAYLGAYVQPQVDTPAGLTGAVQSFEQSVGRSLKLVHVYVPWGRALPGNVSKYFVRHGKVLLLTWGGAPNTKAIIAGRDDAMIRASAEAVKRLRRPILLEFRHEMDRGNLQWTIHGPADYIKAWDHIRSIFTAVGATNASWVWCPTGYGFQVGRAQAFYPGNKEVDWVCADVYANSGQSLSAAAAPFLSWARQTHKPIILGEFAAKGSAAAWPAWLAAAARLAESDRQIRAMAYFDANGTDSNGHPFSYWLGRNPKALALFGRLLGERFFRPGT